MKKFSISIIIALFTICLMTGIGFAEKTYKLRLATVVTAPHPWITAAEFMANEVEARTDGHVKISIHPSSSLGTDQTTIDEMRMGTIDIVFGGTSPASVFVSEFQIFSLPYLFKDYGTYKKATATDSPVFKALQQAYVDRKLNLRLLALGGGGVRNCSNNQKPIAKPEDMKGMKMRVPGNPIVTKIWAATGAIPSPMPWNEIYSAIQTGVVNSFESSISGYYGSKYYEVAPFHSKTQHQFMTTHISMSEISYKKLPAEYQKVVEEVAAESGVVITDEGKKADEMKLKELIDKYGVNVNDVDKEAFISLFAPLQDELAESIKQTELLELIRSIK